MSDLAHQPETGTGALQRDLARRLVAEALGTGFLVMAVVGSGIMASLLSPDDVGLQLLENAAATAGALIALIWCSAPSPAPTSTPSSPCSIEPSGDQDPGGSPLHRRTSDRRLLRRCAGKRHVRPASHRPLDHGSVLRRSLVVRSGRHRRIAARHPRLRPHGRTNVVAVAVGVWIGGAYFFTSSTSFANPAVTIARTLSDTFAGIAPTSAPMFIAMQLVGAAPPTR